MRSSFIKRLSIAALALLLAIAGLTGLAAGSVYATPVQPAELTIGDIRIQSGQSAVIPVTFDSKGRDVGSYNLEIGFDPASFEVTEVEPQYGNADPALCEADQQGCFQSHIDNDAGWVRAIWVDISGGDRPFSGEQELFKLHVKAKNNAAAGDKAFTIAADDAEQLNFTGTSASSRLQVTVTEGKATVSRPTQVATVQQEDVSVYIDGKLQERTASASTETIDGRSVTTVKVDNAKVIELLGDGRISRLLLPLGGIGSASVVSELNGALVKAMEKKAAVIEIETPQGSYTLPAQQINIDAISAKLGEQVALQDIKIRIKIETAAAATAQSTADAAARVGAMMAASPVAFEVQAVYGDTAVTVDRFNNYVERSLPIGTGADLSGKTLTGVVVETGGTLSPVPTRLVVRDGRTYAVISSLTNSVYAVIGRTTTFADVARHWSRAEVDDLAARLVVSGTAADTFSPDRAITRAEFTAIAVRALGLRDEAGSSRASAFADVASGSWYAGAVQNAVLYKLIGGYDDGTFRPNGTITRAEASVLLVRASALAGLAAPTSDAGGDGDGLTALEAYTDTGSVPAWARPAMAEAVRLELLQGAGGQLSPGAAVTRAQTAVMVHRLLANAGLIGQ